MAARRLQTESDSVLILSNFQSEELWTAQSGCTASTSRRMWCRCLMPRTSWDPSQGGNSAKASHDIKIQKVAEKLPLTRLEVVNLNCNCNNCASSYKAPETSIHLAELRLVKKYSHLWTKYCSGRGEYVLLTDHHEQFPNDIHGMVCDGRGRERQKRRCETIRPLATAVLREFQSDHDGENSLCSTMIAHRQVLVVIMATLTSLKLYMSIMTPADRIFLKRIMKEWYQLSTFLLPPQTTFTPPYWPSRAFLLAELRISKAYPTLP